MKFCDVRIDISSASCGEDFSRDLKIFYTYFAIGCCLGAIMGMYYLFAHLRNSEFVWKRIHKIILFGVIFFVLQFSHSLGALLELRSSLAMEALAMICWDFGCEATMDYCKEWYQIILLGQSYGVSTSKRRRNHKKKRRTASQQVEQKHAGNRTQLQLGCLNNKNNAGTELHMYQNGQYHSQDTFQNSPIHASDDLLKNVNVNVNANLNNARDRINESITSTNSSNETSATAATTSTSDVILNPNHYKNHTQAIHDHDHDGNAKNSEKEMEEEEKEVEEGKVEIEGEAGEAGEEEDPDYYGCDITTFHKIVFKYLPQKETEFFLSAALRSVFIAVSTLFLYAGYKRDEGDYESHTYYESIAFGLWAGVNPFCAYAIILYGGEVLRMMKRINIRVVRKEQLLFRIQIARISLGFTHVLYSIVLAVYSAYFNTINNHKKAGMAFVVFYLGLLPPTAVLFFYSLGTGNNNKKKKNSSSSSSSKNTYNNNNNIPMKTTSGQL